MSSSDVARKHAGRAPRLAGAWLGALFAAILAGFRTHRLAYLLAATVWAGSVLVAWWLDTPRRSDLVYFFLQWVPAAIALLVTVALTIEAMRIALVERHRRPLAALGHWARHVALDPGRLAFGLHGILILFLLMSSFGFIKESIPRLVPFYLDATLMELDRALFFGHHPWEVLHPVLGFPPVTYLIDIAYRLWVFVMFGVFLYAAFALNRPVLRMQYILASILAWGVGGSLLAVLLSSAGPCYYSAIGLDNDPYAPLMAYLARVDAAYPVWVLDIQQALWDSYSGRPAVASGISAMPSMHVMTATLFVLLGFRVSRGLGIAMTAFAAIILAGSVHLGWHYAVDGLAAIPLALIAWHVAGRLAAR